MELAKEVVQCVIRARLTWKRIPNQLNLTLTRVPLSVLKRGSVSCLFLHQVKCANCWHARACWFAWLCVANINYCLNTKGCFFKALSPPFLTLFLQELHPTQNCLQFFFLALEAAVNIFAVLHHAGLLCPLSGVPAWLIPEVTEAPLLVVCLAHGINTQTRTPTSGSYPNLPIVPSGHQFLLSLTGKLLLETKVQSKNLLLTNSIEVEISAKLLVWSDH